MAIGAVLSIIGMLGSAVANGIAGAKASAADAAARRRMRNKNQMWYDREYNSVGRETRPAQVVRELLREHLADRVANSKGRGAVMGGTNALEIAQRAEDNRLAAKVLGQLDAQQDARRDRIDAIYRQREGQIDNLDLQASAQKQQNLANMVTTSGQVLSQVGSAVDGGGGSSKVKSESSDAAGESAAKGGSTSSQTTWKAPKVKVVGANEKVKSGDKVIKAPDPYKERDEWRKQFDKDYFKSMLSKMS